MMFFETLLKKTLYVNVLSIRGGKKWQQDEKVPLAKKQLEDLQVQLLEEKQLLKEEQQEGKGMIPYFFLYFFNFLTDKFFFIFG